MAGLPNKITVSWSIEDVKELDGSLSDDQCREVLRLARENHDASVGINWDVLEVWVDEVRDQPTT